MMDIKKKIRKWLGIEDRMEYQSQLIHSLKRELDSQIEMVGVDVHMKNHQSEIIVISRLGGGTVSIKPVYFQSVSEMMNFIKYMDQAVGEHRMIVDPPYKEMKDLIYQERKRK